MKGNSGSFLTFVRLLSVAVVLFGLIGVASAQVPGSGQYCAQRAPSESQCFDNLEAAENYLRLDRPGETPGRSLLALVKTEFEGSGLVLWSYAIPPVEASFKRSEFDSGGICRDALGRPCSSEGELGKL